jgi:oxygen-dependent protoporphyrinogen oxidase
MARSVIVVGGGVSGLVAAHRLRAHGADVTVLEGKDAPGGWLRTVRVPSPRGEMVVELGPDSVLGDGITSATLGGATPPKAKIVKALLDELALWPHVIRTRTDRHGAFVVRSGRLERIPEGWSLVAPGEAAPVLRSEVLSPLGRLRAVAESLVPRAPHDDETLASFARRRVGWEALERLAQPLASGIYGADAELLGLAATLPRFLAMEAQHGSVRAGIAARPKAEHASGARYGMFFAFDGGMQTLIDALASALGPRLETGRAVVRVSRRGAGHAVTLASGEVREADQVVIALPAPRAAPLLAEVAPEASRGLARIAHGNAATVTFGFLREDVSHPLDAYGYVCPAVERRRVMAATFASEKWPGRAPDGVVLVRTFVGGPDEESLDGRDDAGMARTALRDLDSLLGLRGAPFFTKALRYERAMPRYAVGHVPLAKSIDAALAPIEGVALAGNALFGVGIPDAIASGERAAQKLLARG